MLALASTRLARAVSTDDITQPLRDRLNGWASSQDKPGWRSRAAELVGCPVCTGWWISLGVSLSWPGRRRVSRGVAVAGAQVLLTLAERLVSEQGRMVVHRVQKEIPVPDRGL